MAGLVHYPHMSQPPAPYDRSYSFTDFSQSNPTTPHQGQKIDQELNNAQDSINATISRLGEIQADDGKIRTTALNLAVIAEEVEPLLTDGPVQAVNAAGSAQVALVNDAGDAKVAELEAVLSSQNALDAIAARDAAQSAAYEADLSKISAANSAGLANTYAITALQSKNSAAVFAQVAQDAAASIPLIVGPVGPAGPQGIQGQQGIQGVAGESGTVWTYRGEYDGGITYASNDYVSFQGASYVLINFIGAAGYDPIGYPGSWQLVASKGVQGPAGNAWVYRGEYDTYGNYGPNDYVTWSGSSYVRTANYNASGETPPAYPASWQLVAQKGDTGANGADGADGVGVVNWRGEFNPGQFYFTGDVVSYNGSSYAHSMPGSGSNQGNYPDVSPFYWTLVAQAGSQGVTGDTGATGQNGQDGAVGPSGPSIAEWDSGTTYSAGNAVTYNNAIFVCVSGGITGGNYPPENAAWTLASENYFARNFTVYEKVNRSGDTFTGKVNTTVTATTAPINIGSQPAAPSSTVAGDLWIGANINYKSWDGITKAVANTNTTNQFTQGQNIVINSSQSALRIQQLGTGAALFIEDQTSQDPSPFVVDQSGKVGIGVYPDATAALKLDANGMSFNGLSFNATGTASHTGGSSTLDLLVTINGVNYRIGLRPA